MADHGLVQCRSPFSVTTKWGTPHVVANGDIYWATDPVVKGHEQYFTDVYVKSSVDAGRSNTLTHATGNKVETADAPPSGRRRLSKPPVEAPAPAETSEV